jgi:MarR family transcriptional regulator, organic hydroperoxide resistance regulator
MVKRLLSEIKQTKPIPAHALAQLELMRTADHATRAVARVLKPYNITPVQYNVLRILRGAGKEGLPCGEIADRMITQAPDITRLLDRMNKLGLLDRKRQELDRRVVVVHISEQGLKLVNSLDEIITEHNYNMLSHFTKAQISTLIDLLELARTPPKSR